MTPTNHNSNMPLTPTATSPSDTSPSVLPSVRKIPRTRRIGGYTMIHRTAEKWAARLRGVDELDPSRIRCATQYINRSIRPKAEIRFVGEEVMGYCMIVTQMAKFREGYKDMPSSEIPQFVPSKLDQVVYDFLISQGIEAQDLVFQTFLD